ncbi:PQQ-like beta-propeller repeat protein [Rhodopirellula sp.]|nr:PQQ-like beta-propeller repeat protein [Rhodopirellula sp.]
MAKFLSPLIIVALVTVTILQSQTANADWPAFLGGESRSSAAEFTPPLKWTPAEGIGWQVKLPGHGQSSPIIVGDRIYLTAVEGPMKNNNLVLCHSLITGELLWKKSFPSSLPVANNVYTSRAAPTPSADATGVFAFFESGNLVALTPEGEVRWERDLIKDYGKYVGRFGLGGSVAQLDGQIFIVADNDGPSYIAGFDKKTGKTTWKTDRASRISWSSPMMVKIEDKDQIVISSSGSVDGYNPADGKLLWSYDNVGGNTVPSTIDAGNGSFLVGASPGRNGEASEGAKESNLLMQVVASENGFTTKVVWRSTDATSSFGSPILYKGHAYYTNRAGVLYCIDSVTGETSYTARLAASNWATPVGVGEHIFFFGKDGRTSIVQTGSKKEILDENRLWNSEDAGGPGGFGGEIQYGVAPTPNGFVVRTGTNLFLIGKP